MEVTGVLGEIERLVCSRNGNPRFTLTIGGKLYDTETDGAVNYEITNYHIGREVTATLGKRRKIVDIHYADRSKA